jgi:phosphatidylglycerophosphatase A
MAFLKPADPPPAALRSPEILLGSLGLSGFVPAMRGTAGTVVAAVPAALLIQFGPGLWVWWLLAVVASGLSLWAGAAVISRGHGGDPGWFVMDEAAGLYVGLAVASADNLLALFWVLLVFRVYDIAKPWPVRAFERLPGTTGILADDLAAGLFAGWTFLALSAIL